MRSITKRKPNNFVVEKYARTMVGHKSLSVGYDGHVLSKESLKNNGNIKRAEVV